MALPIDKEILMKHMAIPGQLAELSYKDPESALHYMRIWGEKQMPVTPLFDELSKKLLEVSND